MPLHLALEERFDPYSFVKYIKAIGRAYQRQAIELVSICRLFVESSPENDQHDAKFKEAILAVDEALRRATDAGKKVTVTASNAFAEAQKMLLQYEESAHPGSSKVDIVVQMTKAKAIDQRSLGLFNRLLAKRGDETPIVPPTVPVNFILLKSLLDPKPPIVRQVLSARPMTSEIIWNFSRYTDDRRIPLRQNPHFYLDLPTTFSSFKADFVKDSTKAFQFKRNDTVYVLVDKPDLGRIYVEAEKRHIFGNVWKPNDVLIFKDIRGRLEGEQLVRNNIQIQRQQKLFWRNERDLGAAKPWELQEDPWNPVTDIQDWKELIQEKILPSTSTRTSVKICVNHANSANDEASRASDKGAVDISSQRPNVPSGSNTTHAPSSVHVGSHNSNLEVPPSHSADPQSLPKTHTQTTALGPVPPNAHGSQPIPATSPPIPIPTPTSMPMPTPTPASLLALPHAHAPPITATPRTMTQSPSPLPDHPRKLPATLSQNNASSPQAPATPSVSSGTKPSSKPIGVTPITNPQPVSKTVKSTAKQSRNTKADKPAPETKGPAKSSITFSAFTQKIFKPLPLPSMPGAFPGPDMDVDWVMVTEGPADMQGGNWLKRLFRKPH